MDVNSLLKGIGIKVFIEYFQYFNDLSYTTADMIEILPNRYTEKSRRTRTSKARTIIKENKLQEAFRYIINSQKISQEIKDKAIQLSKHIE